MAAHMMRQSRSLVDECTCSTFPTVMRHHFVFGQGLQRRDLMVRATRPSLFTDHQPHPERNNQVDKAQILIAANRGPVSFSFGDDGSLQQRRGAGGLVSGMISVATEVDSIWVCTALSDADRRAAAEAPGAGLDRIQDLEGMRVQMLDIPEQIFKGAYNGVANSTLWLV